MACLIHRIWDESSIFSLLHPDEIISFRHPAVLFLWKRRVRVIKETGKEGQGRKRQFISLPGFHMCEIERELTLAKRQWC